MKKIIKILGLAFLMVILVCGFSYLTDKTTYTNWKLTNNSPHKNEISWAAFEWGGDTLSGKYYDKASMQIPCRIKGLPNVFTFQFDLGADLTEVYENSFSSFYPLNESLKNKIKRLRSPLQFWNNNKILKHLEISFGNYRATNEITYLHRNYGEEIADPNLTDTFHLGTIGSDLFKNRILIIDYPKKQFAILDSLPKEYAINLINIEIDNNGNVILPMKIHNQFYRIAFDNGSSLFPIITEANNISKFSTLPDTDTIEISSWGTKHSVTGRMIRDSFEIAGLKYSNVRVYTNHTGLGGYYLADGVAGNALFWGKTIIIDFKNKKFGVK
ncbi:MAG: hypothetical protein ACMG51_08960 [Ginsengibacter sp.]